jgi:hypothetical protein
VLTRCTWVHGSETGAAMLRKLLPNFIKFFEALDVSKEDVILYVRLIAVAVMVSWWWAILRGLIPAPTDDRRELQDALHLVARALVIHSPNLCLATRVTVHE